MKDLKDYREEIDNIDKELCELFLKRENICLEIAHYKKENDIPVLSSPREAEIVARLSEGRGAFESALIRRFYGEIFEISRDIQAKEMKK